MNIVVHDFAGHPGQVQLSRELARRGHTVEHQYCASVPTGRGAVFARASDPASFRVQAIDLGRQFSRYSPIIRIWQELRYAFLTSAAVKKGDPDVAIFANVPIAALLLITISLRLRAIPYIFWWQDFYSEGVRVVAETRLGIAGAFIGRAARWVERTIARGAATVVPITEAFVSQLDEWDVSPERVHVIPNWAALEELPPRPRVNPWAEEHELVDVPVVMYAGTIGLKHDPSAIAKLARRLPEDCRVVIVSEGSGREWLEMNASEESRLRFLDYQPFEQLPDMLASADILLVMLESNASRYSVPSKALTYLCAGRPVLAILPPDNAIALMIQSAGAGIVVSPDDQVGAYAALNQLLSDPDLRNQMGMAARRYAELNFHIEDVADRFQSVIEKSLKLSN